MVDQTLKQLPEFNADEAASRQLKDRFNVVEATRFFFVSLTSMKNNTLMVALDEMANIKKNQSSLMMDCLRVSRL